MNCCPSLHCELWGVKYEQIGCLPLWRSIYWRKCSPNSANMQRQRVLWGVWKDLVKGSLVWALKNEQESAKGARAAERSRKIRVENHPLDLASGMWSWVCVEISLCGSFRVGEGVERLPCWPQNLKSRMWGCLLEVKEEVAEQKTWEKS